jgi:tetratricopeptide (TPR) repeat protein
VNTKNTNKELFAHAMSYLMNDDIGKSIELLDQLLDSDPSDKLVLLARGSAYLKSGQAENAIGDFSRAIDVDSGYAKAYHLRGLAQELAGEMDAALKDFGRAIEIDSEYGAAYYSRATLLTNGTGGFGHRGYENGCSPEQCKYRELRQRKQRMALPSSANGKHVRK